MYVCVFLCARVRNSWRKELHRILRAMVMSDSCYDREERQQRPVARAREGAAWSSLTNLLFSPVLKPLEAPVSFFF